MLILEGRRCILGVSEPVKTLGFGVADWINTAHSPGCQSVQSVYKLIPAGGGGGGGGGG